MRHGAAPNLPKAYNDAIDGLVIGNSVGSCGTAAYRAEQVIVSDIATDPLWADFRELALAHSLRACWSTPIFSSEGKVIGTFAMYYREPRSPSPREQDAIRHITYLAGVAIQRKLAEAARRESEAYLAEAQRLSHTGSWAWAPATGEIRYWSEESYRLLGFDPHAGPPRFEKFFERLYSEDQVRVRELFENAIREKTDFETDYRIVHPGGAIRNIHAVGHPVSDESGNLVEFVGTVMDITESKRSEEALRASEQVTRGQVEALAQSLDVLATAPKPEKFIGQMLSTIGRLLNAQSVSLWLFDESTDSPVLRSMVDGGRLVAPDPEHPLMKDPLFWKQNAVIQELLFTAGPVVCEDLETDPRIQAEWREYLKRKGAKRFLAVPILVGGQVRGFVGIRHPDRAAYRPEEIELTQALAHQVMLAIQLNEFAEQGQRAAVFEERNRMARDIHDTLAQGFTGVIVQLEAAEDAISCGCRKEADNHLHRAGELARRSLSEARRSVHALRPQALEEHNFWDALKGSIKNTTAGTALHTTFEAQGKLPELPEPWQENLLHIGQEALTNTLKYAHARNFETRISYKAKELRLELRDDGDGFKVKDRHDGVGLTGMRERVEQMGGELEITSSRGKGHEDHCGIALQWRIDVMTSKKKTAASLKVCKEPKSAAKKAPKVEDTKKPRITVLIADDHSVVREGLVSLITRKADMIVVAEAANGREAVDLWKQHHPDVTLLDLRMPELDGVGAIKEIRASDENARIIVLTTFDGDEDIYRAIQAGAKGYLLKDVPREALMDCIRRVHAGETCVPVHLAAKLAERVSGETLSAREIDVLKLMAQGKSNKEIGSALFISEGTVKSHVKAIFAKMNVISRTEAVATATRRGMIQL